MKNLINPKKLQKGDIISIVSPSAGLGELFPHRIRNGVDALERMGFRVKIEKHALNRNGWVSGTIEERVEDLHSAFSDPAVKCVMCSSGGNHSNQLLAHIDFEIIKKNPKIFIGYSDITALHWAIMKMSEVRTFYGPGLMTEFAEYPETLPYTIEYFRKGIMDGEAIGQVEASEIWSDEFLDWNTKKDLERPRKMNQSVGYEWWKTGKAEGKILGGAIPTINHLVGTKYWMDPSNSIFFLDIPEGNPGEAFSQSWLDSFLADLGNVGLFSSIKGLIIGRPYAYDQEKSNILKKMIDEYTKDYSYPILYNANIGHVAPIITLPFGTSVLLDSDQNTFTINETGVGD